MNMRLRLILAFVLVVVVGITGMLVFIRADTAENVRQFMYRGGMIGAEGLVSRLEEYYSTNGSWQGVEFLFGPGGMMPGMGRNRGGGMMGHQRIRLAAPEGRILYDSDPGGTEFPGLSPAEMQSAIPLNGPLGETAGYLMINGGMNVLTADAVPLIERLNQAALRAGGIALAAALVLALLLAAGLLRPIHNLTIAAEHLAEGDLNTRVPVRGHDELSTLARAFNTMTESLQQSEERRKAMTADIAHELRTPLSVQRAQLEAIQDGIYPLTIENLQPVLDQNEMLSRLVDDLRTLALADAGELPLERVWVDLNRLLDRSLTRFKATAEAKKIIFSLETQQPGAECPGVWGDPVRLEQILNNLLSNAIRHTPEGGQVRLEMSCYPDWLELRVRDSGKGIPPDAMPYVFDRFYRASRSRTRDEGGSGLGLSIARQLALAHGGTLVAENYPAGGAVFTLRLPVQPGERNREDED